MGTFIILSVALLNASKSVDYAGTQSISYMSDSRARNICNSMTSVLLARIADSTSLRIETPVTTSFLGGTVTYSITTVNAIGNSLNDDHQGDDHGDDHEGDDHEGDDHGDDHGDDEHSMLFSPSALAQNSKMFSASMLNAFYDSDEHSDDESDHESDDHEGDDHESDDHDSDESGNDTLQIIVQGIYGGSSKTLTTYVALNVPTATTPTAIQGGVSTRNAVATSGNMQVDGRNHDQNGALISSDGTYGIWTTSSISQGGSSDIGGTYSGTDYAPSKPANSHVVKASGSYPSGTFPDTPDKIFGGSSAGFSEGTLKNIAIGGSEGSQYATNPSSLTIPLSGITYVELSSGSTWQPSSISGSGVLIVHNSAGNAIIKNLNSGTFKGIIIADDIIHIHATIIGAVIGIGSSPSEGNCLGNGNGSILYSKAAVNQAVSTVSSGLAPKNYGFGKTRLSVIGWYE